jgi:HlyD family secretion protein
VALVSMRPGDNAEGSRIELLDSSQWRVETRDLSELDVVRIREGGKAVITFIALPDLRITGKVLNVRFVEKADGSPPAYRATISLDSSDERLYWNQPVSVSLLAE